MNALGNDQNLGRLQAAYEETSIVLYVWDAYRFCRANDLPIPPWVLRYFDQTAEKLSTLADNKVRRFPHQARQIGIALGLSGGRGRSRLSPG